MKHISITLNMTDDLGIQSVTIDYNDTNLPDNGELLELISKALLKGLAMNNDKIVVQDLLNELNLKTNK